MSASRREFLLGLAATGVLANSSAWASMSCPFRLAVINDELTEDFDRACQIASQDFGLSWIELRGMWKKNITELNAKEIADAQQILEKYKLRVTDIASPLFKVDWPGAPLSKNSPKRDQFHADYDFKQQDTLLDHCIELAKAFHTDRIRCFDFWRLDDPKPYRAAMNDKLREAAEKCAKHDLILLLENEMACNTGTAEEAVGVLNAVPNKNFMLNWDPGNAATFPDNTPYPNGYNLLPMERIGHCHCKDVKRKPDGKYEWAAVGSGVVDWVGQFRALQHDGYHYAVSLETHWRGAGTPEASTRISMQGLKDSLKKADISC
ncbi:sugar phosphate isomerase/epimerase [Alloacidobacterium dinghuense]|uniref:Sugar phosphate isomerase/epimerase n=1 Tax=Alloacidobacterium dinghuense TaxID=2763107 RepID=A0A7G8BK73_9BACT|nr:sugar phosphate isomerase/epimerase family protein [Alloacidobacterium dinghuense]QNI32943.1 sugar phosphate isomerase/epimerase [Alloacidobacterium dinghuense]